MAEQDRITALEHECRQLRAVLVVLGVVLVAALTTLHPSALGMNLLSNNSMVLGLDAPAGTGLDANKERITVVADAEGGASITFKDRRSYVVSRMYLDSDNRTWLQFVDYTQDPSPMRQVGLTGDIYFPPKKQ